MSEKENIETTGAGSTGSTEAASATGESTEKKRRVNPFLEPLFLVFAAALYLIVKPAAYLRKKAYDRRPVVKALGYAIGMGTGIAAGYMAGWHWEWTAAWWVVSGVASALVTYFYAWPAIFAGVLKQLGQLSLNLWDAVDTSERVRYNRSWVSNLLMFLGYAGIFGGAGILGFELMRRAFDQLTTSWGRWEIFALPVAGALGVVLATAAGAIAWSLLTSWRMPFVALVTGGAAVYGLHTATADQVRAVLSGYSSIAVVSAVYAAYALQYGLYVFYLFPLAHVLLTPLFSRLAWLFQRWYDMVELAYTEHDTPYQSFFAHAVNCGTTYGLVRLSLLLWPALGIGVSTPVALSIAALVGFLAYLVLGRVLSRSYLGNGIIPGVLGSYAAVIMWPLAADALSHQPPFIFVLSLVAVVLVYALIVYPLISAITRAVLSLLLVPYWLGYPLAEIHDTIYDGCHWVLKQLDHAYENTYRDDSPQRVIFLHKVNLLFAAAAGAGVFRLCHLLGFSTWLNWSTVAVLSMLSYVLVGKGLLVARTAAGVKTGTGTVGVLSSLALGIVAGVYTFHAVSYGFWTACGVALVAGLLTAGFTFRFAFPGVYVCSAGLGKLFVDEKWLLPALDGLHTWVWNRCSLSWQQVLYYYRQIDQRMKPIMESIDATWEDAKERIRKTWDGSNRS